MVKTLLLPSRGKRGVRSIPGWVTKIPHAGRHSQKKKRERTSLNSFSLWMKQSREVKEFSELEQNQIHNSDLSSLYTSILDLVHLWEKPSRPKLSNPEVVLSIPKPTGVLWDSKYLIKGTIIQPAGTPHIFEISRQELRVTLLTVRNYRHHPESFCGFFVNMEISDKRCLDLVLKIVKNKMTICLTFKLILKYWQQV